MTTVNDTVIVDNRADDTPKPGASNVRNQKPFQRNKNRRFTKDDRPRYDGGARDPRPNHSRPTSFLTKDPPASACVASRRTFYKIHVSNEACLTLSDRVHRLLVASDRQLAQLFPAYLLRYITSLCFVNRLSLCGEKYGYAWTDDSSRLKKICQSIKLPGFLASYIEAIGQYKLRSGAKVVPIVYNNYGDMFPDPDMIEEPQPQAKRKKPTKRNAIGDEVIPVEQQPPRYPFGDDPEIPEGLRDTLVGPWRISPEIVELYNTALARAAKWQYDFRSVEGTAIEAKPEMVVSYVNTDDGLRSYSPEMMLTATAQLGACYRFRDDNVRLWPNGDGNELLSHFTFVGEVFDEGPLISSMALTAIGK